ncbi:MAG: helix-turn-helix domain-containing protein [Deltaproteobacteria bacterium]|nr:helix-turn-helix domain-containing protein [Deltaproteobacteria bacterium]
MEDTKNIEPLLDAKEVKKLLRCSLPWIYKAADQGLIPCVRIPCQGNGSQREKTMVRFKREDVFRFIEKHYNN